ncbi:MAG: FecR family protein [Candidatus Symbiothrix sp.]|jgi:ferric-dicitrate binding protein FerR (iron transport regulator)|nr:FecR family protein [Candidatus Symbiothrix sp.]
MENTKYTFLEDFIFHPALIALAKENNREGLLSFLQQFPGQEECIQDAWLLLQSLKIEEADVPAGQIDADFNKLKKRLKYNKIRRIVVRYTASAACLALFVLLGTISLKTNLFHPDNESDLLSYLDLLQIENNEIQLIMDSDTISINNRETIFLTEEGNLIIGSDNREIASKTEEKNIQMMIPYGRKVSVRFCDGTNMWVNAGSKVLYPKLFSKNSREIYAEGEIYLDVTRNEAQPFIVHTSDFDVRVLGTRFNVYAYPEEEEKSVVLVNGSVEVATSETKQKNKLSPNQGFFLTGDNAGIREVDTSFYTCWLDDVIKLDGESLDVIFDKLCRKYNVAIIYDKIAAHGIYKGKLNLNDSIEETLYNLSLTTLNTPFSYTIKENKVNIKFK